MAASYDQIAIQHFSDYVKIKYQAKGFKFRGTYEPALQIIGNEAFFPTFAEVEASEYNPGGVITQQDPGAAQVSCPLEGFYVACGVPGMTQVTTNVPLMSNLSTLINMAMGRKEDQLVIGALEDSDGFELDGTATDIYISLLNACEVLNASGVDEDGRFAAISPRVNSALLQKAEFVNSLYTVNDPISTGTVQYSKSLGLYFIVVPNMLGGGLPLVDEVRTNFIWQRRAMGGTSAQGLRVVYDRIGMTDTNQIMAQFLMGYTAIDATGIVKLTTAEAPLAALSRSARKKGGK